MSPANHKTTEMPAYHAISLTDRVASVIDAWFRKLSRPRLPTCAFRPVKPRHPPGIASEVTSRTQSARRGSSRRLNEGASLKPAPCHGAPPLLIALGCDTFALISGLSEDSYPLWFTIAVPTFPPGSISACHRRRDGDSGRAPSRVCEPPLRGDAPWNKHHGVRRSLARRPSYPERHRRC
jgi:hypothetical protein